jgi:hypothetical protein
VSRSASLLAHGPRAGRAPCAASGAGGNAAVISLAVAPAGPRTRADVDGTESGEHGAARPWRRFSFLLEPEAERASHHGAPPLLILTGRHVRTWTAVAREAGEEAGRGCAGWKETVGVIAVMCKGRTRARWYLLGA